jgi:hypothetical protein
MCKSYLPTNLGHLKQYTTYYIRDPPGTNGVLLYKQSIQHILCSQSNNGAVLVPESKTCFAKARKITLLSLSVKKWRLGEAEKKISRHFHLRLKCT